MTLPKPSERKRAYAPRDNRKADYPDDDTLIRQINFTSISAMARILGISQQALSYYLYSRGLEPRLFVTWRKRYLRDRRARARDLLALVLDRHGNGSNKGP